MASYADYFLKTAYKPTYFIGDRVFGRWNKIPFIATVGNDTLISLEEGPKIHLHLDLPIKYKDKIYNFLTVKHKDVRPLRTY